MDRRERLAVHRPGKQDLGATRLVERDRATEALGRLRLLAKVGATEADVRGLPQRAGEREHVGERDAGPRGGTSSTGTPRLLARDVADGHQTRAPVAGALQRRGHRALPQRLAQGDQRKVQLPFDGPMQVQPPRLGIDLRHRAVPPYVEGVRGGQRTLGQRREPGLGVERLLRVHDEVRALSVGTHPANVTAFASRRGSPDVQPPHAGRHEVASPRRAATASGRWSPPPGPHRGRSLW